MPTGLPAGVGPWYCHHQGEAPENAVLPRSREGQELPLYARMGLQDPGSCPCREFQVAL